MLLETRAHPARGRRSRLLLRKDRKSTRLNSSHGYISYAVFCLKKKKARQGTRGRPGRGQRTTAQDKALSIPIAGRDGPPDPARRRFTEIFQQYTMLGMRHVRK